MKKYKNGEPITKEFSEMTYKELLLVDAMLLTSEESEEFFEQLEIHNKRFKETMSY